MVHVCGEGPRDRRIQKEKKYIKIIMAVSICILYTLALAFLPISPSPVGVRGALNITGYSTDLLDCLVVTSV